MKIRHDVVMDRDWPAQFRDAGFWADFRREVTWLGTKGSARALTEPAMHDEEWTADEDATLLRLADRHTPILELVRLFKRTDQAIRARLHRLRLARRMREVSQP